MTEPPTGPTDDVPAPPPPAASLAFRPPPAEPAPAEPPRTEVPPAEPSPAPDEPPPSEEAPAVAPPRRTAGLVLTIVLLLATAGLAVGLVLTALDLSDANSLTAARTSALAAARTYSVELAGYDYRHLTQDFGVVLSHSTASFRKSFSESSSALVPTLTKYRATASAKIVAAGVVSSSTSQVVVLVLLDQTVTNSTQKAPTVDRSQIEITLVPSAGQWLIDQVTLL